jgi:hypothetical protein
MMDVEGMTWQLIKRGCHLEMIFPVEVDVCVQQSHGMRV